MRFIYLTSGLWSCLVFSNCTSPSQPAPSNNSALSALDSAEYEQRLQEDAAFRLNQEGDQFREQGKYQEALERYQMAMDSAAVEADSFGYYDARLDLATVHDRLGELQTAIDLALPILEAYKRSGDSLRVGRAYSTLSAFYGRAKMLPETIKYAKLGFEVLKNDPSLIHRCAAYNQLAFTYSDAGKWSEALPYLDSALTFMIQSKTLDQMPGMQLNLGNCYRNLGRWAEATRYFEASLVGADSTNQIHIKAKALERLSQVAEATQQPEMALARYKASRIIMDSLFTAEKSARLQQLELAYQTREREQEIEALQLAKSTESLKKNFTIALAACLLFLLIYVRLKHQEKVKRDAKALENSRNDLQKLTQLLVEKNSKIVALESESPANAASHTPDPALAGHEAIDNLYNIRILTEQDWEVFKQFFERGHPQFIYKIRNRYPQLTSAEERLLLLIKLKLNRHEIASTLGISPESVKKGRQRLRKKLGLEHDDNLESFVEGL